MENAINNLKETGRKTPKTAQILLVIMIVFLAFGGFKYYTLSKDNTSTKTTLANKTTEYEGKIATLELEKTSLNDALDAERSRNEEFEDQIEEISGVIGTLEKLSRTDPELLKKYSKVYFLNEHYEPPKLVNIDNEYLANPSDDQFVLTQANYFLKKLMDAAEDDDNNLKIVSAYRSFGTQASLKSNYSVIYGAGTANQFSADQGYSEHQLGTAFDFANPTLSPGLEGFEKTPEYKWMVSNAYKYGFILSYPQGNTYYKYEPWHWRFVGIKLAKKLHSDDMNFYDMDQREIDKFLINIFDKS